MTPSIFDHPLISSRYFFPRPDGLATPFFVVAGKHRLACHAQMPHRGAPTLVHFHGNGEVVADYVPDFADALNAAGLNVLFAEYRGYGPSTGQPTLVGMLDDVEAILAAVGRPAEEIVVYGRSVGSIYALELAARCPRIRGLVIESGLAEPLERILMRVTPEEVGSSAGELMAEARRHLDHRAKLHRYGGPLLVLHAEHDQLMPISNGERLAAWAGAAATLRRFPAGDHNTILLHNAAAIIETVREFATRQ